MANRGLTYRMAGSCGELLQGKVDEREVLISYPVNLYNYLTIGRQEGSRLAILPRKMQKMAYRLQRRLQFKKELLGELRFIHRKEIPIGVGMASSTVDLTLMASGLSNYLGYKLTIDQLIELLVEVEPTDSIIFPRLTLFEQNEGSFYRELGPYPTMKILMLGTGHLVNTLSFKADLKDIPRVSQAYQTLKRGLSINDLKLVGLGAMLSAFQWQNILEKPLLARIQEIVLTMDCYGFNIAHSGGVIGILYSDEKVRVHELKERLMTAGAFDYYPYHRELETAAGGVELLVDDGYIGLTEKA